MIFTTKLTEYIKQKPNDCLAFVRPGTPQSFIFDFVYQYDSANLYKKKSKLQIRTNQKPAITTSFLNIDIILKTFLN